MALTVFQLCNHGVNNWAVFGISSKCEGFSANSINTVFSLGNSMSGHPPATPTSPLCIAQRVKHLASRLSGRDGFVAAAMMTEIQAIQESSL